MIACPKCNRKGYVKVLNTRPMRDGRLYRRNKCQACNLLYNTIEAYVPDGQQPCPRLFRRDVPIDWRG